MTTAAGTENRNVVMVKRRIDDRIPTLIDGAVKCRHRSLFLLIGDKGKDQIVNLHAMVSRAQHRAKVSVLWCMKSDPVFASVSKKRLERHGRLEVKSGVATETSKEAFEVFLEQTDIRFCKYEESHKILGNTYGMAVLQDFEALTPNILARTIETVAGGGIVVLMLRSLTSLNQLYTLTMDVHARFRTAAHKSVVPRFNERFLLSLCDCSNALVIDDDLNVMPITTNMRNLLSRSKQRQAAEDERLRIEGRQAHDAMLAETKRKLKDAAEIGPLVGVCQTMDQAKTVLSLAKVLHEKSLTVTCALTAARGRGKSAALGLSIAAAVQAGYSNIFVTAPSPDNVQTLFQFVIKGLMELGYKERLDFETLVSSNPDFAKGAVLRVSVHRDHRQTVQFISADDSSKFGQAELLVIDEAAAIPLPMVQKMLGNCLVFISSTVSGYEGTGRSLSMKLIADMRARSGAPKAPGADGGDSSSAAAGAGRTLKEMTMTDPIRYGPGDPLESWLTKVLCLDATTVATIPKSFPHCNQCDLYYVNRDSLFSYHPTAETLLQQVVSLFVAAHYKNQPNDLQLLSDAPAHHIFALCGPMPSGSDASALPDVYCVVHVCEEGSIDAQALESQLGHGSRPSGDLIPYTIAQHYLIKRFASAAGVRVVRIATHPEYQKSGYGSRALSLLFQFLQGCTVAGGSAPPVSVSQDVHTNDVPDDVDPEEARRQAAEAAATGNQLLPKPRAQLPPLLQPLTTVRPPAAEYIGVSYGLNLDLFNFWRKNGFQPVYVRQMASDTTGEHSCIMLRSLATDASDALRIGALRREFLLRFLRLLPHSFRSLKTDVAVSCVVDADNYQSRRIAEATVVSKMGCTVDGVPQATYRDLIGGVLPSEAAVKRLSLYASNFIDKASILDLVTPLAEMYFAGRLYRCPDGAEGVLLTPVQSAVLLAVGLQCLNEDAIIAQDRFKGVAMPQLRAFFHKAIETLVTHVNKLRKLHEAEGAAPLSAATSVVAGSIVNAGDLEEEGGDEEVVRGADGGVVGLTVRRDATVDVAAELADSTLIRDAKRATFGQGASAGGSRHGGGGGGGHAHKRGADSGKKRPR